MHKRLGILNLSFLFGILYPDNYWFLNLFTLLSPDKIEVMTRYKAIISYDGYMPFLVFSASLMRGHGSEEIEKP